MNLTSQVAFVNRAPAELFLFRWAVRIQKILQTVDFGLKLGELGEMLMFLLKQTCLWVVGTSVDPQNNMKRTGTVSEVEMGIKP